MYTSDFGIALEISNIFCGDVKHVDLESSLSLEKDEKLKYTLTYNGIPKINIILFYQAYSLPHGINEIIPNYIWEKKYWCEKRERSFLEWLMLIFNDIIIDVVALEESFFDKDFFNMHLVLKEKYAMIYGKDL